ncbi:hypothetical protein DQ04_11351010 [Trypanosoma grayi]|uniref:hypothetical protein n=1 Tax=Trypanosoma grayi TaxID=71804 RepID=UPI0004F4A630|nr:hypothetical protein DQ04_11351010 [Trypanosoma grayi]KEG06992.1 hypothetical protein DQ04_11351010 [Trypanosoma grayi]
MIEPHPDEFMAFSKNLLLSHRCAASAHVCSAVRPHGSTHAQGPPIRILSIQIYILNSHGAAYVDFKISGFQVKALAIVCNISEPHLHTIGSRANSTSSPLLYDTGNSCA